MGDLLKVHILLLLSQEIAYTSIHLVNKHLIYLELQSKYLGKYHAKGASILLIDNVLFYSIVFSGYY